MIPGTATQLVATTTTSPGAGASTSGAATGDGAFAEALAGAQTVLETAESVMHTEGSADAPVPQVATPDTSEGTATGATTEDVAGSDGASDSNTAGDESTDEVTSTEVPTAGSTSDTSAGSAGAAQAAAGATQGTTGTVVSAEAIAAGQHELVETAIRLATRTTDADAVAPAHTTTSHAVKMEAAQAVTTAGNDTVAGGVQAGMTASAEASPQDGAGTTVRTLPTGAQDAEATTSGKGAVGATGTQTLTTDEAAGLDPAPSAGSRPLQAAPSVASGVRGNEGNSTAKPGHGTAVPTSVVGTTSAMAAGGALTVDPSAPAATLQAAAVTNGVVSTASEAGSPAPVTADPDVMPGAVRVQAHTSTGAAAMQSVIPGSEDGISVSEPGSRPAASHQSAAQVATAASAAATASAAESLMSDSQSDSAESGGTRPVIQAPVPVVGAGAAQAAASASQQTQGGTGNPGAVTAGEGDVQPAQSGLQSPAMGSATSGPTSISDTQSRTAGTGAAQAAATDTAPSTANAGSQGSDAGMAGTPDQSGEPTSPVLQTAEATRTAVAARRDAVSGFVMAQERIDHIAEQLATRLRLSRAAGGSEVQLQLRPRELGEVTVQMNVRNGIVAATVVVDRVDTGRLLQSNLDDLRRSLESQGLSVQQFSVDVRGGDAGNPFERMNMNGGFGNGFGQRTTASSGEDVDTVGGLNPGLTGDRMVAPEDLHDGNVSVLV